MNNDKPKRVVTREDLKQPPGATLNRNSDGTAKTKRQIEFEQSIVDLANSLLSKIPPKEEEQEDD